MTSVKGKLLFFRSEFFKNNPPIISSCILDREADGFLVKSQTLCVSDRNAPRTFKEFPKNFEQYSGQKTRWLQQL